MIGRRNGVSLATLVTAMLAFAACVCSAEGRVLIDGNGNGILDAGEAGVPCAVVSDGVTVLRTTAGGRFDLAIDAAAERGRAK